MSFMKKVVICTIMSLVLTNCQNIIEEPLSGIDSFSFFASTEDFSSKTKTHIDDNNNILWSPNDQLAIFQGSSLADKYQVTEETAGTMNGKFDIVKSGSEINDSFNSGTEVATNVAIYPFAESLILSAATSDREDTHLYNISGYTLPSEQEYARNSFAEQSFPMVAVTADLSDHNLKFKNVTGAIKLNIKGDIIVKSIKIKGNNGEKLSGPATIFVHSDNSAPTIKLGNDANNGVTGAGIGLPARKHP